MKRAPLFLVTSVMSLPFFFSSALAANRKPHTPKAPVASAQEDLTLNQLETAFINFDVKRDGEREQVTMFGIVFKDCFDKFQFSNSDSDPAIRASGLAGLRVRDLGGGRSCMARHKAAGETCGASGDGCVRLSQVAGASLDFTNYPHVRVGLLHVDPMKDSDAPDFEFFDAENPIEHKTAAELAAEHRAAVQAAREATIDRLRRQFATCRRSTDELVIAKGALDALINMDDIAEDEVAKAEQELDDATLQLFVKKTGTASDDELAALREDVASWAADHADRSDALVKVYYEIAKRYMTNHTDGTEGYDNATATFNEALNLAGISDAKRTIIAGYERDIKVSRLSTLAQGGLSGNYLFWPSYAELAQQMQQEAMTACSGTSLEGCANALNAANTVARMPAQASAVDQQRYAVNQQIQRSIAQATQGYAQQGYGQAPAANGAPMWAGGVYGN